jgi:hypothetical protein
MKHTIFFALLLATPTYLLAQEDPVEAALRRGTELRRTGHDDAAMAEFRAAYEQRHTPRTAALYGLVAQATGHWIDAERLLREALSAPDDAWVTRNRASLEDAQRTVSRHVGTLDVQSNVAGASLEIDGRSVGSLPLAEPLRVLVGALTVTVRAPGHVSIERRVSIEPGVVSREVFDLSPVTTTVSVTISQPATPPATQVAVSTPPVVAAPVDRGASLRSLGYGGLALGGITMVLGATGLALRESSANSYNTECPPPGPGLSARCASFLDTETTWGTVGSVLLPLGAVVTAASAVLFWRGASLRTTSFVCAPGVGSVGCAVRF